MSGPPGLGMVAQRRAMYGMRARSGSQRTPAPPSSSGVPHRTRADTSAGRVAARWRARSAPSDMPATASAGTSRRRRISSGGAVKPCTSRQPRGREPASAKPSAMGALAAGESVAVHVERTLALRALLQVAHVRRQHGLVLLTLQRLAQLLLGALE